MAKTLGDIYNEIAREEQADAAGPINDYEFRNLLKIFNTAFTNVSHVFRYFFLFLGFLEVFMF